MHEALKELTAELAVLHESLERAEVIERQLPTYLREIEAERDEAITERDQLRAQLGTASNNARLYADKCTALESSVAGLRRALEEARKALPTYCANPECRADRCIDAMKAHVKLGAALAASPTDHARRIKVEVLRATASELESLRDHIQEYIGPDDARDDIRRICWNRAKDLRDEADRLEAPNAAR